MAKPCAPERIRRFLAEASARMTSEEFDMRVIQVVSVRAQTHGLSPAESDILLRFSFCESREQIAAARGASPETIRKQIVTLRLKLRSRSLEEAALQVLREACGS